MLNYSAIWSFVNGFCLKNRVHEAVSIVEQVVSYSQTSPRTSTETTSLHFPDRQRASNIFQRRDRARESWEELVPRRQACDDIPHKYTSPDHAPIARTTALTSSHYAVCDKPLLAFGLSFHDLHVYKVNIQNRRISLLVIVLLQSNNGLLLPELRW